MRVVHNNALHPVAILSPLTPVIGAQKREVNLESDA